MDEDFDLTEHLKEDLTAGELDKVLDSVADVIISHFEQATALRDEYLGQDFEDEKESDILLGRLEASRDLEEYVINTPGYPKTADDLVDFYEAMVAELRDEAKKHTYVTRMHSYLRGYQRQRISLLTELEEHLMNTGE